MNVLYERLLVLSQPAREYWRGLNPRERKMMSLAGGVLLFWLVWQSLFVPLDDRLQSAKTGLVASQNLLLDIQQQADQIRKLQREEPDKGRFLGLPLDEMVHRTGQEASIPVLGVRSVRDSLQVELGEVGFDRLLNWLILLEMQGGVEIRELDVEAAQAPGEVDVNALRIQKRQ